MNFMANGVEPLCFDNRPTQLEILRLTTQNAAQLAMLRELVASARKNGVKDQWTTSLKLAIAKNRLALPTRSLRARISRILRSLSRRVAQARSGSTGGASGGQLGKRGNPGGVGVRPN